MKIVDMFGCGLPVCALNFACLYELVKDGENGLVFDNAAQLAKQLESLFEEFPSLARLSHLRTALRRFPDAEHPQSRESSWSDWEENWNRVVKPLVSVDNERYVH
jgi:beta-1,4-mannosyltransferase